MTVLSFIYGSWSERKTMRDAAVAKGKAEYYLDANNRRKWRWKT